MSRDWQKDMEMMKGTFEFDWTNDQDLQIAMGEALPYWLQQYAAEKERGDQAEAKAGFWEMEYYALQREYNEYRTIYPPAVLEEEET